MNITNLYEAIVRAPEKQEIETKEHHLYIQKFKKAA